MSVGPFMANADFFGFEHLENIPQILIEANTWEFDSGLRGFLRFLMFKFSCQNKIANISVMVKALRKCKYGLELPLNLTNLIKYVMKTSFFRPQITNCFLGILVFKFFCQNLQKDLSDCFEILTIDRQNIWTKIMCTDWSKNT